VLPCVAKLLDQVCVCAQRVHTVRIIRLEGTALQILKIFMAKFQELFDPPLLIFSCYAVAS